MNWKLGLIGAVLWLMIMLPVLAIVMLPLFMHGPTKKGRSHDD